MKLSPAKSAFLFALSASLLSGAYILSILFRVSVCEQNLFGRSYLIPLKSHPPQFNESPVAESFGDDTYTYERGGSSIRVYKQLANGFQHTYASALVAFETGPLPADLLFRANEYAEAIFCRNAATEDFFLDTKKDLANNAIGREIGVNAKDKGKNGRAAEQYIQEKVLEAMASGRVWNHYRNPAIADLPTFESYGCPYLFIAQKKHL
jgi:hypothetical protein